VRVKEGDEERPFVLAESLPNLDMRPTLNRAGSTLAHRGVRRDLPQTLTHPAPKGSVIARAAMADLARPA